MRKKYRIKLTKGQRKRLEDLTRRGSVKVREYKRARVLMLAGEEQGQANTDEQIAEQVGVSTATVQRVRQRFVQEGLEVALHDKPRPGAPPKFSGRQKALVTALACTQPPEGHARWSLRLLADKLVELEEMDDISYRTVGRILKKTSLNRTSNASGASES